MQLKLRVNKILESGLLWQLFLFAIVNICVFIVFMVIYFLVGRDGNIGLWQALRLFVDSNSLLDPEPVEGRTFLLLAMEVSGTILFSGLIVSIITNVITIKVDAIKEGHIHYKLKDHVVIIGYDNIVPSVISEIVKDENHNGCKIILQTSDAVDEVRNDLLSSLSLSELKRIIIIHAPRQSVEELNLLYTKNAREVYIVGDRKQADHDAENMHTFEELVRIHKKAEVETTIPLTVWFENEASYAALQLNNVSDEWTRYFEFRPYNFYKRWANRLLTKSTYNHGDRVINYPELDHDGIGVDSKKHVHLIIIGMNRMGTALAKKAAHLLHFPNFNERNGQNRTRITFIDDNADREMDFFIGRHPGLFRISPPEYVDMTKGETSMSQKYFCNVDNFLDVQFEFIKGRVESYSVREWLRQEMEEEDSIISIAICVHNPSQSFGMAMYLPEEVYTRGRYVPTKGKAATKLDVKPWDVIDKDKMVNIFVRQEKTESLIKAFSDAARADDANNKKYANLFPFGMVDDSFSLDYYSNDLAMAFNYIYDYYFSHDKTLPSSIPSKSEIVDLWKQLPVSHQWSNLYLADSIEIKLRSIGLDLEKVKSADITERQMEDLSRTEHNRWNMEKLLLGYRSLTSEEKTLDSASLKQLKTNIFAHQLIVPYKDLSEADKDLDRNIIIKIPDIIKMLNK